jgi:hypothetical protein
MKNRKTYKVLTWLSWFVPMNRFYLGERISATRLITLNYFMMGIFADLFYMDKRFDEAMAKRGFVNSEIRNSQAR